MARTCSDTLLREIAAEFPRFRIVPKEGDALSTTVDRALRLVTFGRMTRYSSTYFTVLGHTLYVPPIWFDMNDVQRVILLRHERVHLRQRRRLSGPVMALFYLLPLFPLGLAYGRAMLEWEAYEETIRATAELKGLEAALALKCQIVGRFVGPDYGWMWPFPGTVGRWYARVIAEITSEMSMAAPLSDRTSEKTS